MTHFRSLACLFGSILVCIAAAQAQIDAALNFYPMHVGDCWEYESHWQCNVCGMPPFSGRYTVSVIGDTVAGNGRRYFVVEVSSWIIRRNDYPRYQRLDSASAEVFAYDTANGGGEFLVDSLRATPGSVFFGCRVSGIQQTHVAKEETLEWFDADRPSRSCTTPSDTGVFINYTLTEGLGLTVIEFGYTHGIMTTWSTDTLIFARIESRKYFTSVPEVQRPRASQTFGIDQNYPNPFNPISTIRYSTPAMGRVTLQVFDVLGRLVATLVDDVEPGGKKTATFDGSGLSSGIYVCRLKAGNLIQSMKMVLMR